MNIENLDHEDIAERYQIMIKEFPPGDRTVEQEEMIEELYYWFHKKSGMTPKYQDRFDLIASRVEARKGNNISENSIKKHEALIDSATDNEKKGGAFVKVMYEALDNPEWLKANRNKTTLYLLLLRYVCRKPIKGDKFDIFNRYYMSNKLACCVSEEHLAAMFGYKKDKEGKQQRGSIQRMLSDLEQDGAFIVERIKQAPPLKPKKVYVLGEFKGGKEYYYWK